MISAISAIFQVIVFWCITAFSILMGWIVLNLLSQWWIHRKDLRSRVIVDYSQLLWEDFNELR